MHRAKTPKLLISVFAVLSLVFGGLVATIAPASAETPGCFTSGYQPSKCSGDKTLIPDINEAINTAVSTSTTTTALSACVSPTFKLYVVSGNSMSEIANGSGTNITAIAGLNFSSDSTTKVATVSGTATSTFSTKTFIITATCSDNSRYAYQFGVTITATAVPAISPLTQSVQGTVGTALQATASYSVVRFTATPVFSIDQSVPAGLTFNTANGQITGTPTAVSTLTTYTVAASSSVERVTATIDLEVVAAAVSGGGTAEPDRKVTICHRTHAVTNPYVRITVDYNSVNKKSGHQIHDEIFSGEHVFKAGIYKRAKDKDWGDIIPADPSGLNRWKPLNWTTLGAQIYNGTVAGCPAYDAKAYYNALREAGVPEKQIKKEIGDLETEQSEANPGRTKTEPANVKYTGSNSKVEEEDNDKVTLCHRTNSVTNPYVRITVSASSVYKNAGHYGHDEIYDGHHVFDSTVTYPNNKKDWGDIIPADPSGKGRWAALNMTALGKKIYDGEVEGCAEKTLQQIYNELREEKKSKKEIIEELKKEKNVDDDPKDIDELTYTGNDPQTEKTEPKEPTEPANVKIPDQSLSGIVWLDLNKDGLKDADEPFMKNIKLYVVQVTSVPNQTTPAAIGSVRAAGLFKPAAITSVLTDANGFYLFPSLGAGDWKVTTTVPQDLYVTYDSHESSDGEITTTVPPEGHAFTWVGLVSDDEKKNLEEITKALIENPNAIPLSELPPTLRAKASAIKAAILSGKKVTLTGELAYTGDNNLALMFFGVLLLLCGGLGLTVIRGNRK